MYSNLLPPCCHHVFNVVRMWSACAENCKSMKDLHWKISRPIVSQNQFRDLDRWWKVSSECPQTHEMTTTHSLNCTIIPAWEKKAIYTFFPSPKIYVNFFFLKLLVDELSPIRVAKKMRWGATFVSKLIREITVDEKNLEKSHFEHFFPRAELTFMFVGQLP